MFLFVFHMNMHLQDITLNITKNSFNRVISKSNITQIPASTVVYYIELMECNRQTHTDKYIEYCLAIGRLYSHRFKDNDTARLYYAKCSSGIEARMSSR
jgi:hypothetical protein